MSSRKPRRTASATGKSGLSSRLSTTCWLKGLIQADGFVRAGKTYARTFSATMNRPEYYAKMVAHTLNDKELVVFKRALKAEVNAADAEAASGVEEATESAPAEEA